MTGYCVFGRVVEGMEVVDKIRAVPTAARAAVSGRRSRHCRGDRTRLRRRTLIVATLFISDLHLDPSRPAITALFLDFLRGEAAQAEALYILGDLFEAWVGDDEDSELALLVGSALRALVDSGVPVFVMRGNRDFLLGPEFARKTGATLLADPCVIHLCGQPTLLMHGDLLCSDDLAYLAFRQQVRDPQWQENFLAQSLDQRRAFAGAGPCRQARQGSPDCATTARWTRSPTSVPRRSRARWRASASRA